MFDNTWNSIVLRKQKGSTTCATKLSLARCADLGPGHRQAGHGSAPRVIIMLRSYFSWALESCKVQKLSFDSGGAVGDPLV